MENRDNKKTPEDFLVQGLEDVEPAYADFPGRMYAGTLPMDNGDRHGEIMFWLFEPEQQVVPNSLVIWLNGGPGCSSFNCGVMMEHSPVTQPLHRAGYCCVPAFPKLSYNEYTWTKATTMLYVEQPIGTGFSFGHPYPEDEHEVSADLYAWMQNFYDVFEHLSAYNFYIMGESYAGMFVPAIGRYFHLQNQKVLNNENAARLIPLKGAALGNGWVDAEIQGPATIDYSWWHGLIDKPTRDALHNEWKNCMARKGKTDDVEPPPFHPFNIQDDCGIMWGVLVASGFPNAYDITTWDPNVDQVTFTTEVFFNRPEIKKILHAPENITWHGCRQGEGRRRLMAGNSQLRRLYMDNDRPLSVVPYIAELVDADIPVLVYNGDRDMTTNMVGTELALNGMEWSGKDEWLDAPRGLWMFDNEHAGWAKEYKKLSYVVVYNSGHMVPYNQPGPSMDLLQRFLLHNSFMDQELPKVRVGKIQNATKSSTASPEFALDTLDALASNHMAKSNPFLALQGNDSHFGHVAVATMSFLAGVIVTLFLVRGGRRGYQRVPEA